MSSQSDREPGVSPTVLVVDDEDSVRHVLKTFLEMKGCQVLTAMSAEDAESMLAGGPMPDVALVDIVLPGKSGLVLLTSIRRHQADTEVILMTSYGSVDTAIRAIRNGAYDYLQKPFESLEKVWSTVQKALDMKRVSGRAREPVREA